MILDEYDFEHTARALMVMNESVSERFLDWEDLASFMRGMAYTYCNDSNSFSTAGFVLTVFDASDGTRNVRASVSAHVAHRYVEKIAKETA